ncbi:MAG: antibiotic biosynthesis monooxygenase [Deltaproteobacteria bacterium]|nr:antibiotic biosynthesis monooxygenase [Deltaproteobacteria bacterium]
MYARVHWGKIKPGMWDEYERYYDQKVVKSTEGMKGFRGRRLLRSTDNPEEGISISLWEAKEDLESYVGSSQRKNLGKEAERLYSGEYWVKHFEVRSSTI